MRERRGSRAVASAVVFILLVLARPARVEMQPVANALPSLQPRLVAISVPHLGESVAWYREHLGFVVLRQQDFPDHHVRVALIERDQFRVEIVELAGSAAPARFLPAFDNPAQMQGFGKLAFRVDDLDAWATKLRSEHVRFHREPSESSPDGSRSFIVLDNARNWLQFVQEREPAVR